MKSSTVLHLVLTSLVASALSLPAGLNKGRVHAEAPGNQATVASKKVYVCPPCGNDCDHLTFDKPGVCPHCGMTLIEKTAGMKQPADKHPTVAILLFDGVEIIDYSGPWEVFGAANFAVHTVAAGTGPIKTVFGQKVIPDYTLENSPHADILLIPGGGISKPLNDSRVIGWIQSRAKESRYVVSVCNGAFILAKAGLLDGLSATTTRGLIGRLAKTALQTKVVHDQRYVDNGKVITTGGLSAGIDRKSVV
jgi:putative intracellular protease/amidase/DNA-directed RNA polymerase subunit RPC12/RpoP